MSDNLNNFVALNSTLSVCILLCYASPKQNFDDDDTATAPATGKGIAPLK